MELLFKANILTRESLIHATTMLQTRHGELKIALLWQSIRKNHLWLLLPNNQFQFSFKPPTNHSNFINQVFTMEFAEIISTTLLSLLDMELKMEKNITKLKTLGDHLGVRKATFTLLELVMERENVVFKCILNFLLLDFV